MRIGWIALVSSLLAGCGSPADEPHATGGAEALEEAPSPASSDEPAALDPDSVCGRALACCEAYAAAIPNVVPEAACAGPAEATADADADERCRRMIAGWRETLELLPDVEPPPSCAP